jgi:hypothetical protein
LFTRTRYQNRSMRVKSRENGLRVWEFRCYEPLPDGTGRALRAVTIGTLQEYPSEAAARKSPAVQAIVLRINAEHPLGPVNGFDGWSVDRTLRKGGDADTIRNARFISIIH